MTRTTWSTLSPGFELLKKILLRLPLYLFFHWRIKTCLYVGCLGVSLAPITLLSQVKMWASLSRNTPLFVHLAGITRSGANFTPPLPRALSNTLMKMSHREQSKSPPVTFVARQQTALINYCQAPETALIQKLKNYIWCSSRKSFSLWPPLLFWKARSEKAGNEKYEIKHF